MPDPSCPICHRPLPPGAPTSTHPFCSPRCKMVDLGNWLDDRYVVAGPALDDAEQLDAEALAALLEEPS
jgi:endogenous inhibitor of DNA gyrase (YacG/DUF329 family)